jgi:hypothetical protein
MKINELNEIISCVGKTDAETRSIVNKDLGIFRRALEDSDWYYYEYENGVTLEFEDKTKRLMRVSVCVVPLIEEETSYSGDLPYGITNLGGMRGIRTHWGEPVAYLPPIKYQGIADTEGCDIYNIDAYPDKKLIIGYTPDLQTQSVHVELR